MLDKLTSYVNSVNDWGGRIFCLIIYPLVGVVCYDVLNRYLLGQAVPWSFDMTWMLYAALTFLGGAYTFLHGGHAKVDILVSYLSERKQKIITIICYLIFFLPAFAALTYATYNMMVSAWTPPLDRSSASAWRPLLGPIRTVLFISILTMLIQGIVFFLNHVRDLLKGEK